jgi:hypothetical protein
MKKVGIGEPVVLPKDGKKVFIYIRKQSYFFGFFFSADQGG